MGGSEEHHGDKADVERTIEDEDELGGTWGVRSGFRPPNV